MFTCSGTLPILSGCWCFEDDLNPPNGNELAAPIKTGARRNTMMQIYEFKNSKSCFCKREKKRVENKSTNTKFTTGEKHIQMILEYYTLYTNIIDITNISHHNNLIIYQTSNNQTTTFLIHQMAQKLSNYKMRTFSHLWCWYRNENLIYIDNDSKMNKCAYLRTTAKIAN